MTKDITYPPVEFLFFNHEQPSEDAWGAIEQFADKWNQSHSSKFKKGEIEELGIILKDGIYDDEYPILKQAIAGLQKQYGVAYFLGASDKRRPEDYEKSAFIAIVGNTYPSAFIVNFKEAIGTVKPCPNCGNKDSSNAPILESLIIDESFLDKQIDKSPDYTPPGLDLINLANGALLVSARMGELFHSLKIKGYELIPVISNATQKPSERLFLLRANKAILLPCDVHTPTTEEGICPVCGKILGGILGNYYVREEWLDGDKIFARHPLKYAFMYVSNDLYHEMKKIKARGLLPAYGIYKCTHIK